MTLSIRYGARVLNSDWLSEEPPGLIRSSPVNTIRSSLQANTVSPGMCPPLPSQASNTRPHASNDPMDSYVPSPDLLPMASILSGSGMRWPEMALLSL